MKKIIFICLLLGLMSCEKRVEWEPQDRTEKFLVVEGSITNEVKAHQVKLSRPVANLNVPSLPVSGAVVTISDGTHTWLLTESDTVKGTYFTAADVSGTPGNTYQLRITLGDTLITATDIMGTAGNLNPLKYSKSGNNNQYQITWVASSYLPNTAAMYEILLDWSALPAYADTDPDSCRARLFYFTLTTIDVSDLFSPAIEKITFPKGTVITERKYSLSPAHEEFIRCLLLETSWRGGLWDAVPANLPTNLSGTNAGFFYASSVNTATIIAD